MAENNRTDRIALGVFLPVVLLLGTRWLTSIIATMTKTNDNIYALRFQFLYLRYIHFKRDSTIEKQIPLSEFHHWLKVPFTSS